MTAAIVLIVVVGLAMQGVPSRAQSDCSCMACGMYSDRYQHCLCCVYNVVGGKRSAYSPPGDHWTDTKPKEEKKRGGFVFSDKGFTFVRSLGKMVHEEKADPPSAWNMILRRLAKVMQRK